MKQTLPLLTAEKRKNLQTFDNKLTADLPEMRTASNVSSHK